MGVVGPRLTLFTSLTRIRDRNSYTSKHFINSKYVLKDSHLPPNPKNQRISNGSKTSRWKVMSVILLYRIDREYRHNMDSKLTAMMKDLRLDKENESANSGSHVVMRRNFIFVIISTFFCIAGNRGESSGYRKPSRVNKHFSMTIN